VDNAIKFTREGGLVLRVHGQQVAEQQWALSFAVIDSGIGFIDLDEATLYQRFFQLDGSMTREYGGLGIGLAICRQLIDLLGGHLTHQSEPGMGSRFQLDVEVEALIPRALRSSMLSATRYPYDCTLLLVDDNNVSQLVVRGMLLKLGYRVFTAVDARAALDVLHGQTVDGLLLDCPAQPADEVLLCRQLRAMPGGADLLILALVSSTEAGERERCLAAGVTDTLSKPVRFDELKHLLARRLLTPVQGESAGT